VNRNKKKITAALLSALTLLSACATGPQLVVDPKSIKDSKQYTVDLNECIELSTGYDATGAKAGGAALGAAAGLGTAALILATGGLYLLPAGAILAAGGGAALGSKSASNSESRAREQIQAACMNERGYKAYAPGG
jgi:hypothetical protein